MSLRSVVCALVTRLSPAKTAEPMEMLLEGRQTGTGKKGNGKKGNGKKGNGKNGNGKNGNQI